MFFVEQKVSRGKLSFFAYVISGERSTNRQKKLRNDAFQVKTSQSAKNQLDPAKNENRPKKRYTPFLHEALQFQNKTPANWACEEAPDCVVGVGKKQVGRDSKEWSEEGKVLSP